MRTRCTVCPGRGGRATGRPVGRARPQHARGRAVPALAGAAAALALVAGPGVAAATGTLPGTVPEAALERRVGHAYRLATGELVYRVIHEPRVDGDRLLADRVRYIAPDGELIARKKVRFGDDPLVPGFRLEVVDTGHMQGLKRLRDGRIKLFHRDGKQGSREQARIEPPPGLVADAGFDILINRRFDALKGGSILEFPLAVPTRLTTIDFRVHVVDRREVLGQPAVVVRMEPANTFFRWLVNPIDIAYDADSGVMLRYEGMTSLPDPDRDGNYRVRIDFPPGEREPVAPEGDEPSGATSGGGR